MLNYDDYFNPVLQALRDLGGSGSNQEITDKVCSNLQLSDEDIEKMHGNSNQTEVDYRIAWAKTYLKKYGILENSQRGIWSFVNDKKNIETVDKEEVKAFVKKLDKKDKSSKNIELDDNDIDAPEEVQNWKDKLLDLILNMSPDAFERLTKRLLRESGFSQVEVTGKSGDGGIDGKGIYKIGGLIGFNVMFQCKRWKNQVPSSEIRDFRGALQGRADKGLFVTTSTFSRDAIKEATRDGATPIDLLDGQQLVDKLKELKLGLKIEIVENVIIDDSWYKNI
jgi:Restriction endonuclease